MYDEMNNVNNVIEVQEYVPENLDNVQGFDPPPSPVARWAQTSSTHDDGKNTMIACGVCSVCA